MDSKQLELFQPLGEHESSIFEQAKLAKGIIQRLYNKLDLHLPQDKGFPFSSYAILKLEILLDLVGDTNNLGEPSSPRVFIWQFTPSFILMVKGEEIALNNKFASLAEPKVIKKWINTLYTTRTFSQTEFHAIASQYFSLELLFNALSNNDFVNFVESKLNGKNLIIYFENKLFPSSSLGIGAFMESDMLKKVNNYYNRLCMLQKQNWYFIGCYEFFTDKYSLLTDLDKNTKVKRIRQESSSAGIEYKPLNEIFQNDFLFLNNYAFIEKKHNTHGWNENYIVSPEILDIEFNIIDEKKLFKANGDESIPKRQLYIYFKKLKDSNFIRTDILIPNTNLRSEKIKEIISIIQELNK